MHQCVLQQWREGVSLILGRTIGYAAQGLVNNESYS